MKHAMNDWREKISQDTSVGSGLGYWESGRPVVKALGPPVKLRPASQHPGADSACKTLGRNTSTASDLNW